MSSTWENYLLYFCWRQHFLVFLHLWISILLNPSQGTYYHWNDNFSLIAVFLQCHLFLFCITYTCYSVSSSSSNNNNYNNNNTPLNFSTNVSRGFFTGVWKTASLLKSAGLFSVFWPILVMLQSGWSPFVL